MSCILVLQNRRDTEKNQESTTAQLPTVIHLPLKVDREMQTDPEPIRSMRRRIRKDAGVITDPPVKVQLSHKECQTSKEDIKDRVQELKPTEHDEFLDPRPNLEPWQSRSDSNLNRASHDSIPLRSREPDGASSEEYPAVSEEDHDVEKKDGDVGDVLSSSEDTNNAKGKKKKRPRSLFPCLSPARLSFRKKSERVNESKTDTAKLVKEI